MPDPFERRVRAAAKALWWTILGTVIVLWLQWWLYCNSWVNGAPAKWFQSLVVERSGMFPPEVHAAWFWMLLGLKAFIWLALFAAAWLTLWARQLAKPTAELNDRRGEAARPERQAVGPPDGHSTLTPGNSQINRPPKALAGVRKPTGTPPARMRFTISSAVRTVSA